MSKWHVIPLSKEQKVYAAIDAYVSKKTTNNTVLVYYFVLGVVKTVLSFKGIGRE